MKAFFQDTFQYTHHCNEKLIAILLQNPDIYSGKISELTSHSLNAHHIWNHRIFGVAPALSVWQLLEKEHLLTINNENFEHSKKRLYKKSFEEKIKYTNSSGLKYTNTVQEIFFHIINHSTYHRGQIISLLKSSGVEPINTDYIFYKR